MIAVIFLITKVDLLVGILSFVLLPHYHFTHSILPSANLSSALIIF